MSRPPPPDQPVYPGRCPNCRLHLHLCLCAIAPRLDLATRVIVVMHCGEWKRSSNSGHFALLTLANAEVRLHGLPHTPVSAEGVDATSPATLVLYPGRGAKPLDDRILAGLPRPATLLVADGNWGQARNMMRRVPMLQQARHVELPGPLLTAVKRPRRNLFADRMSTFEAIAQALGILEGEAVQDQLLNVFEEFAIRMHKMRGREAKVQAALPEDGD